MFKVLANAFKVKDIRDKLIFVFLVLLIYRIGTTIPLPGINLHMLDLALYQGMGGQGTFFELMMGGGYGSVMAMGIAPYITSSIIMQLLTVAIPKLEQLKKEGEEGRKKINQITRNLAVVLAVLQGGATVFSYVNNPMGIPLFNHSGILTYIMATVAMVTGTIFIMWLAELLTERGIGNGASFIIFANILAGMPLTIYSLGILLQGDNILLGAGTLLLILLVFAAIIAFVVLVSEGERRIPVQYSKKMAGRMFGNNSYIPIKVNIAGVMSIIFAISLLQFPVQLSMFFPNNQVLQTIAGFLGLDHWVGVTAYVVMIFLFTFFYTSFAVNPVEMAENMKKNGGFIPGIRPGKPTSDYIQRIVDRLSWIGAVCYSLIAIVPVGFQWVTGVDTGFGGTTLLIATGVALEFIKQLESQLLMRHYKGFLS
ncbi:MAG: preprotein translocase subunit SecY [Defluviitaleaceae bacterium]|nr:preprotein translocase subunit SecY [Defluviitaleaceae bacterium]